MKCERCLRGEEAKFRVHSDVIDMKVCGACAEEAGELGIAVDVLNLDQRNDQAKSAQPESPETLDNYHIPVSLA
jgi:ribosome-binding protein aMBF1 (putative translation factor)